MLVICRLSASEVRSRQQSVNITSMINTYCCVYSVQTPDARQQMSETHRILYQNKFEKQCISLAFIIRIYHDARSSEYQIQIFTELFLQCILKSQQISNIQEEEEHLSLLLAGGFVLNFPELQYANINCKNNKTTPVCLCPMPAGEPPPLGRAGCLQSATHTLAELKIMCTHHHSSNLVTLQFTNK